MTAAPMLILHLPPLDSCKAQYTLIDYLVRWFILMLMLTLLEFTRNSANCDLRAADHKKRRKRSRSGDVT